MIDVAGLNSSFTFEEILNKTIDYSQQKITDKEYEQWSSNIIVKSSLTMMEKMIMLMNLLTTYKYSSNISNEMKICELYKNLFFTVYLGGYLNIVVSPEDATYENYDLLEPIFGPWIEEYSRRDINIFREMLSNAISYSLGNEIAQALENIDTKGLEEQMESNMKLLDYIKKDRNLIADLKDISALNNPELNSLLNTLKTNSIKAAKTAKEEVNTVKVEAEKNKKTAKKKIKK